MEQDGSIVAGGSVGSIWELYMDSSVRYLIGAGCIGGDEMTGATAIGNGCYFFWKNMKSYRGGSRRNSIVN
jgi:hypothetical protein